MRWRLLAISDTHVGEETSLLSYDVGRQTLWQALRGCLQGLDGGDPDQKIDVDELVLIGDIPDRTLSTTEQIRVATSDLTGTLGSALNVGKVVLVPGNHDHTMWSEYAALRYGTPGPAWETSLSGEGVLLGGQPQGPKGCGEGYIRIFFGNPTDAPRRAIAKGAALDFFVANPVYVTAPADLGRTYAFAHGTHFRGGDVTLPERLKVFLAEVVQLDRLLGGYDVDPHCDVDAAKSLAELEAQVAHFTDTLWPSAGNDEMTRAHELWCFYETLSGLYGRRRGIPPVSKLYALSPPTNTEGRISLLSSGNNVYDTSVTLCQEHFLNHLVDALPDQSCELTFVYGDTHAGGYGDTPWPNVPGRSIRLYNTGAWIVTSEQYHPACHVFAVDEAGMEYILDVSFAGVQYGGKDLLAHASVLAEAKWDIKSRLRQLLVERLRQA